MIRQRPPPTAEETTSALEGRWREYVRLYRGGALYSAFVRLAEIAHCLRHDALSPEVSDQWRAALDSLNVSGEEVRAVLHEAREEIKRLQRILSVGARYTYEELVLLITSRVELELLSDFLGERGFDRLEMPITLDNDLEAIASSASNAGGFGSAQAAARKSWGLPLRSRWLGSSGTTVAGEE